MPLVNEIAAGTPSQNQTASQADLIASVVAQQKAIAAQSGADTGDTQDDPNPQRNQRAKLSDERPTQSAATDQAPSERASAEMRSVVVAQEEMEQNARIQSAFQANLHLSQLLSVIRDPEDLILPKDPEGLGTTSGITFSPEEVSDEPGGVRR